MIVLETERMLFRPHEERDRDAFCAMEMDAEVRRYVGGAPRTRESSEERFDGALNASNKSLLRMWATQLKADGSYVGRCGLYPHMDNSNVVEGEAALGFYLARTFWGQGLASEAAQAFVQFGWDELGLQRIVTAVEIGNAASVRVLEKLGFVVEKTEVGKRSFYHFELKRPA
jgi:ribosomal-protein-alanine N-acetyltransferase